MDRYQKGKIYTLRSHQCDKYYIGSTCLPLSKRLYKHKMHYSQYLNGKGNYISSYDILKNDDCYVELLEDYPCERKEQLLKREGELQRKYRHETVNLYIAGNKPNRKERDCRYYKNNKEKISQRQKKYREQNNEKIKKAQKAYRILKKESISAKQKQLYAKKKDDILRRQGEKVACTCGSIVRRDKLPRHKKSKKHINFLNNV